MDGDIIIMVDIVVNGTKWEWIQPKDVVCGSILNIVWCSCTTNAILTFAIQLSNNEMKSWTNECQFRPIFETWGVDTVQKLVASVGDRVSFHHHPPIKTGSNCGQSFYHCLYCICSSCVWCSVRLLGIHRWNATRHKVTKVQITAFSENPL